MTEINDSWKALSDPNRRAILELLYAEALTATEISTKLNLTAGNVSQHLNALKKGELVSSQSQGLYRVFTINSLALENLLEWLVSITPSKAQTIMQIRKKTSQINNSKS
jgi:ArsR family transcriptional regulator, arsenate/arsenite/antimonite-responsive transcriptional repressor